jgi:hypothetical protein
VVAELHVVAVRALLLNDVDEHIRLLGQIDREGSVDAYGFFYKVTFAEAVRQRFGAKTTRGDIIRFVAEARANRTRDSPDLDILAAERLLLAMLGDPAALQRLGEADSALIAPLLIELAKTGPPERLLATAQDVTEQVKRQLAS